MTPFCAAVDWGTTAFRLWLLADDGTVVAERRSDEGMTKAMSAGFGDTLERHLSELDADARLPVMICGMAGAKQGWREAAYADTPADFAALPAKAIIIDDYPREVRILPGVAQRDTNFPDVMRGEETQLLGVIADGDTSGLLCLPGTHSKWASLKDERLERFATFMTGEVFSAISQHTILRMSIGDAHAFGSDDPAFAAAVRAAFDRPQDTTNQLFSIRSAPLLSLSKGGSAAAALSGVLIGLEIAGAVARFDSPKSVILVASGALANLYRVALETIGIAVRSIDAELAVQRGLHFAARSIWAAG